jgi:hypothetical protein
MPQMHPMERQATALAGKIKAATHILSQSFLAAQNRTPFTSKLPESEALAWWAKNRETPLGQQAFARLDPLAQGDLDYNLTLYAQQRQALGTPIETPPTMGG